MRSYITHIRVKQNNDNYPVVLIDGQFIWPSIGYPHIVQYATIHPNFLNVNSNAYTLDAIITEYYYTVSPSPTPIPNSGLVLRYQWDYTLDGMILEIEKESADTEQLFTLSGVGGAYWLNPVPG